MRRRGSCLCGALTYEIEGELDGVWMCHCSNCRKASGGTGNTIVIVPRERFHWLSGEDHRVTYALRPTYKITRCKTCGTPLPAEEDERNVYLTAGTLDDPLGAGIKAHIFYGSRADWEKDADGARYFVERSSGPEVGRDSMQRDPRQDPHVTTIDVNGEPMRASVGVPASAGQRRGVVVMIHGPGLDAFIDAQVQALARHGYFAVAPDLFHRQPDDGSDAMTRVSRLLDREIIDDVDATVAYMRAELKVSSLAILGFCMGGRNTYLLAGARPQLWAAAGVFYGGNIMKAWGDGPSPFDRTAQIACPMIGFFGNDDTNPSTDDVKRIDAELTRLGKPHVFHTYADAGHAFLNFTNPQRHRPTQAADAWAKMLAFLDEQFAP